MMSEIYAQTSRSLCLSWSAMPLGKILDFFMSQFPGERAKMIWRARQNLTEALRVCGLVAANLVVNLLMTSPVEGYVGTST